MNVKMLPTSIISRRILLFCFVSLMLVGCTADPVAVGTRADAGPLLTGAAGPSGNRSDSTVVINSVGGEPVEVVPADGM